MTPFEEDLKRGHEWEAWTRRWMSGQPDVQGVHRVSVEEDKQGTDFVVVNRVRYQVKADEKAALYYNAFVETVSNDQTKAPGWAKKCDADFLLWACPPLGVVAVVDMGIVKTHLPEWEQSYPLRRTDPKLNNGYRTEGLAVPLAVFLGHAERIHWVPALQHAWRQSQHQGAA